MRSKTEKIRITKIIEILKGEYPKWKKPLISELVEKKGSPFKVLIGTILSLRTKDEVTEKACNRLFERADTPEKMILVKEAELAKLIYPVGFYPTKAKRILEICETLIEKYNSVVPDEIDELLKFNGVGRKTANLVVALGYNKPAVCVDTHVHRISNRFGYVTTKTPEKTEFALRKKLPVEYWIVYNDLLVSFGQNVCRPISPFCSDCPVKNLCSRCGVEKFR